MRLRYHLGFFCASLFVVAAALSQTVLSIERISQNPQTSVGGNLDSGRSTISPNGKLVAFESRARNLVSNQDRDSFSDIFVRSVGGGGLRKISVGRGGLDPDGASFAPVITPQTPNGFAAVVFVSEATNLGRFSDVLPDNNGVRDIYFALTNIGFAERISVGLGMTPADGPSAEPSVAVIPEPNRLLVAYTSRATNLVEGDTNALQDVFLFTAVAPASEDENFYSNVSTVRISSALSPGDEPNGESSDPYISGDGSSVVFESTATNLTSDPASTSRQIFLYDREKGTTLLVSKGADGAPGNGDSSDPSISYNGGFVVYLTTATNILTDGVSTVPGAVQVVRYDVRTGRSSRVNVTADGIAGNGTDLDNVTAEISPNGRFVIFSDRADNLVSGDTNGSVDIFAKDLATGSISRVAGASGEPNGPSLFPTLGGTSFTSDTGLVSFSSRASNLIPNDIEEQTDVFFTTLSFPAQPITKATSLEVPPDVVVSGKSLDLTLQSFKGSKLRSNRRRAASTRRKKDIIRYTVTATPDSGGKVIRKRSKKNVLTLANLSAGTYSVSYRTTVSRSGRIVKKTNASPPERVTIAEVS